MYPMKGFKFVFILIVICSTLVGCGAKKDNKAISERVELSDTSQEQVEIRQLIEEFDSGKYVNLLISDKGNKREVIFNTIEGKFESEETTKQLKERAYQVLSDAKGNIDVRNNEDVSVFQTNLKIDEAFKRTDEISFTWSNTKRYLLISGSRNDELLIDLKEKTKVKVPISGILAITWSADDSAAIIEGYSSGEPRKYPTYIWDVEKDSIVDIGEFEDGTYFWPPDNKCIFQWRTIDGQEIVSRYLLEQKSWSVVHQTDQSIQEGTLRFINADQFVYVGNALNDTNDVGEAFLKPREHFAVKVDLAKDKVYQKLLDTNVLRVAFWSFDNKVLYYQDTTGFYKADVDF